MAALADDNGISAAPGQAHQIPETPFHRPTLPLTRRPRMIARYEQTRLVFLANAGNQAFSIGWIIAAIKRDGVFHANWAIGAR